MKLLLSLAFCILWTGGVIVFDRDAGLREVMRRETRLAESLQRNQMKAARNAALAAEVQDLADGQSAVEEQARYVHGMIGEDEVFVQLNSPAPRAPWLPSPNGPQQLDKVPTRTASID